MIFGIFILVAIIGIIASLVIPGAGSSGGNRRSQSNFNNHTTTINPMLMDNQSQLVNNQPEVNYNSNGTSTDNRANCDNSSSGSTDSGSSWSSDSGSSGGFDSGGGGASSDSGTNSSD